MKVFFYTNFAKRFAKQTKSLFLFILSILIFSSCKKELLTGEKETLAVAQGGAVKVTKIGYSGFLEKVNLNSLGTLKTTFQSKPAGRKLVSLGGTSALGSLGFLTDSIKQITTARGNSFVFRMPQASANSRVFQNLTISVLKDTTIAFITTYTPNNEWIINRKNKIHKPYKGEVVYTPISLSTALSQQLPLLNNSVILGNGKVMSAAPNKTMESVTVCNTFVMYTEVTYGCSMGNHMPDDPDCPWNNGVKVPEGEYAAGTIYYGIPVTFCSSIAIDNGGSSPGGPGGGPGGGGGGETSPYPPEGYNPCEPGLPCTELSGESAAQMFANAIGLTDFNHIAFLGDPANVQILGTFKNYLTAHGSSTENKEFLKWAVGYLVDFPDAGINELITNNNIPNSNINLPILDTSELTNYPAFKALVEDLPNFLNNYPNILKALEYTTGFKQQKIMQLMQPGKGPRVLVVHNLRDSEGNKVDGHYNRTNRSLQIDDAHAIGISAINNQVQYQALGLMLTIATLHEFVHFGRHANDLPIRIKDVSGDRLEAGWYFEGNIQPPGAPGYIQPSNAKEWLKFYKVKPKN